MYIHCVNEKVRLGIRQRVDFDVFEQHKSYVDIMVVKLAEEGKVQSTLDGFLSKN